MIYNCRHNTSKIMCNPSTTEQHIQTEYDKFLYNVQSVNNTCLPPFTQQIEDQRHRSNTRKTRSPYSIHKLLLKEKNKIHYIKIK